MTELQIIKELINVRMSSIEKKIENFDKTISEHILNSAEAIGDIKLLKNNQEILTKDLQKNFDQHAEFYGLFKLIDKQPDCQILIKDLKEDVEKEITSLNKSFEKNDAKTSENEKAITKAKTIVYTLNSILALIIIGIKMLSYFNKE